MTATRKAAPIRRTLGTDPKNKDGKVAAVVSLGVAGDDGLPADPKLRALHLERRDLERRVESLRLLKESMDQAKYTSELEKLVTAIALKTTRDSGGGRQVETGRRGGLQTRLEKRDRMNRMATDVTQVVDLASDDIALADRMNAGRKQIVTELKKIIVGQDEVISQVLMTLFVGGNSLIVGAPGLAKTLLIHTMARVLDLKFSRIQFTPDLMPSDITGTDLVQEDATTGRRQMVFAPGPIFANIVLADEINRTPPKTQSALLEAMQEHRVTVQGKTYHAGRAVLRVRDAEPDRAGGHLPAAGSAARSLHVPHHHRPPAVRRGARRGPDDDGDSESAARAADQRRRSDRVPAAGAKSARGRAGDASRARHRARHAGRRNPDSKDFIAKWVAFGASVRAAQYLVLGGKARALTSGRYHVSFEDIRALTHPVLRHRIITNFHAQSEGVTTDAIVDRLLESVPLPRSGM